MSRAAGFKTPGLTCVKCGVEFALSFFAPIEIEISKLPDPFDATCLLCKHQATYPKSAIHTLVAQPHQ